MKIDKEEESDRQANETMLSPKAREGNPGKTVNQREWVNE
jgi:hypothetical protein